MIAGRRGFSRLVLILAALLMYAAQPVRPASAACATYGDQYNSNNYMYDLLLHPATTCFQYFNSAARVLGGQTSNPACGIWAVRSDAPGFQYTSGNQPCFDWLVVRIQMPDQSLWDYSFAIAVYPPDDPLPEP
jgi:hypothetical protein